MAQRILVTGGTGTLGRAVVRRLLQPAADGGEGGGEVGGGSGDEVVMASRRPRPAGATPYEWATVDYTNGGGLDQALTGVSTVIHCMNDQRGAAADHRLVHAARRVGDIHLVYVSIVGLEKVPFGYYRRKVAVERLIQSSGLPWTILRATQFHDLVATIAGQLARLPVAFAPAIPMQPIDVREVAARLVELAGGSPAGRVADMGGPEIRPFKHFLRSYLEVHGLRRPVVPFLLPGKVFSGIRQGGSLVADHAVGRTTFEQYLAQRPLATR